MNRQLLSAILIGLLTVLLVGCGNSPSNQTQGKTTTPADGKIHVTFWHVMGGPLGEALDALIEEFHQQHPNIKIDDVNMGQYTALSQKIMASVQAGNPPVMAQMYETWTTQLIESNALVPLQNYVDGENGYSAEELADFHTVLLENNRWDGKLWTFPFNKSVPALYYNMEMFQEKGIEAPPATWDEFMGVSQQLTSPDADGDGKPDIHATAFVVSAWTFECLLYQNGGRLLAEDGSEAVFNSPAGVEAMQFLKNLLDNQYAYLTTGYEHQNDFLARKLGMIQNTIVSIGFMADGLTFPMGLAPLPRNKKQAVILSGTNVGVFDNATPAQKEAAWTFIKWFSETEQTARWAAQANYLAVRKSALETDVMKQRFEEVPGLEAVYGQLDHTYFEPRTAAWFNGRRYLEDACELALRGTQDIASALNDAASKTNREIEKANR
ncbi:MAG: ABC transporter substrate-binding protein [Gemmatimonadetes bacterium]|nr:MAG: ABC transporter substrate-binding protein [Gemmatimonadota bacterium]